METPHVLLVEGADDQHVIQGLLRARGIANIHIKPKGGWANLRETLDVELKASGLLSLGVVADADSPIASRWQSLRDVLRRDGMGDAPERQGTILPGEPRVGLWLMPDNSSDGVLEQFVELMIPKPDQLWLRAGSAVDQIPAEHRRFALVDTPKAKIHTWLAWQERPGVPMGTAITAKFLDPSSAVAVRFTDWVRRLVSPETGHDEAGD